MCATPPIVRRALRLAAAGWMVASLSACASSIDAERSSVVNSPAIAAQAAAQARLSLVHYQARYRLNLEAGMAQRPAASHGALLEAYRRWTAGKVKSLPDSSFQTGQ